ncbi:Cobyrinic acid ac-diamide synthase [Methanohalobium evestigatum Z-7303]|uniref:Cobyrinic acid ac-diamide synthase n=1 Tax=Methanohalobium evestigatum (strain ATCC BAA-1072 / DSM 3721 / NBRC 107634 / OCM 161 / Z-7303) TaxID=644295 RepID=D7E7Z9_METEZ|nr:AAA family ATPase [Methanohalobium evestigatum]ADI73341.1 Cobyrinic acid ac-diamide synthase [Methanohalobium evestigatum Z-7303]
MTRIIAVTGKGGTGKTAITAMLMRHLVKDDNLVLAVDADPDTNLPDALGCEIDHTLGEMREFMLNERDNFPPDSNKESVLESKVYEAINEMDDYDLLVMGRPEGPGCYCYVNNLLRGIMTRLVTNYDAVIIDTEAGLEHFSRKLIPEIDDLIVVTDGSKRGMQTGERIRQLVGELETKVKNVYVVANKVTESNRELIEQNAKDLDLRLLGAVPVDKIIEERDLKGLPLFDLPDESVAIKEINNIANDLNL